MELVLACLITNGKEHAKISPLEAAGCTTAE